MVSGYFTLVCDFLSQSWVSSDVLHLNSAGVRPVSASGSKPGSTYWRLKRIHRWSAWSGSAPGQLEEEQQRESQQHQRQSTLAGGGGKITPITAIRSRWSSIKMPFKRNNLVLQEDRMVMEGESLQRPTDPKHFEFSSLLLENNNNNSDLSCWDVCW